MDLLEKAVGFPQNELQAGPWEQGSWGAQSRALGPTMLAINTNSEQRFLAICPFIFFGPQTAVGGYWTTVALVYRQLSVWKENQSVKARRKISPPWTFLNTPEHPDHRYFQESLYSERGTGMPAAGQCWACHRPRRSYGLCWCSRRSLVPQERPAASRMEGARLKQEISGIWGNRCAAFPQVGTSHGLRICAILKSLPSVSSLPPVSRTFIYLMTIFFPFRISCESFWACLHLGPHK